MALKKILELKGDDWMKGISTRKTIASGGIFKTASKFNPFFRRAGYFFPQFDPAAEIDAGGIYNKIIKYFTPHSSGGVSAMYAYASDSGATELYSIVNSSVTMTDVTANITTTGPARGATMFQGRYVYAYDNAIKSRPLDVTSGSDVNVLTSGVESFDHEFAIGADKNLYFTNDDSIGKIITASTTTGNTDNIFSMEAGMHIRDLESDGRYLIWVADDAASSSSGNVNCSVCFWDYSSPNLVQRYDFQDRGVVGVQILDGNVYVFCVNNLYVCNVGSQPRSIMSFISTGSVNTISAPSAARLIIKKENSILWANSSDTTVYAYGNQTANQQKIFYTPYAIPTAATITALGTDGFYVLAATNTGATYKVYNFEVAGAGTSESTITLADTVLDRPYKMAYAKVVTRGVLTSGESVKFSASDTDNKTISAEQTFSYAADGAKRSRIFYPSAPTVSTFHELGDVTIKATGTTVQSFELWGEEVENQNQTN